MAHVDSIISVKAFDWSSWFSQVSLVFAVCLFCLFVVWVVFKVLDYFAPVEKYIEELYCPAPSKIRFSKTTQV